MRGKDRQVGVLGVLAAGLSLDVMPLLWAIFFNMAEMWPVVSKTVPWLEWYLHRIVDVDRRGPLDCPNQLVHIGAVMGEMLGSLLFFAFHRVWTAALTRHRGAGVDGRGPWGADGRCRPGRDITALKNVFQYGWGWPVVSKRFQGWTDACAEYWVVVDRGGCRGRHPTAGRRWGHCPRRRRLAGSWRNGGQLGNRLRLRLSL